MLRSHVEDVEGSLPLKLNTYFYLVVYCSILLSVFLIIALCVEKCNQVEKCHLITRKFYCYSWTCFLIKSINKKQNYNAIIVYKF